MANIKRANTSGITKTGVAISDVPDAPTIGAVADSGDGTTATVAYTAAATGGAATTFTATSSPGGLTGTGSSPITVSGLTAGTAYTFTVTASNSTGSNASAASSSLTLAAVGAFESIATATTTGQSSFSFTSIPSTYKHLQIRFLCIPSTTFPSLNFTFNSSTTGYALHILKGTGSDASATGSTSRTSSSIFWGQGMLGTYGNVAIMDIIDYASTTKTKVARSISGQDNNAGTTVSTVEIMSHLWNNTSAISSIQFTVSGGGPTLLTGSSIALYGIKGS